MIYISNLPYGAHTAQLTVGQAPANNATAMFNFYGAVITIGADTQG